ncbi:hypothetical protein [Actinomadura oligospora]|nr:hypothetical protein [Actinomadura oligospora]
MLLQYSENAWAMTLVTVSSGSSKRLARKMKSRLSAPPMAVPAE